MQVGFSWRRFHTLPHAAQRLREYLRYDGQLFGTQHVVEYQEETRSHEALTYDHNGTVGTWSPSELPPGQALRQPTPLLQEAGRERG